jgi:hypothetical protein
MKYRRVIKQQPLLKYPGDKGRYLKGKEGKSQTSTELVPYRDGQTSFKGKSTTFEQSRTLRLCHKCNEKYFSSH